MIILTSLRINKPGSREVETFATGHTVAAAVTVITAGILARSVQIPVPSPSVSTTAVPLWIQAPPTTAVKVHTQDAHVTREEIRST